ncbi:MAG: RNA methyltransferase [Bdellovibrionales bacterium]|nr:RNA methyltransferase [Oligoflexia bacterium]
MNLNELFIRNPHSILQVLKNRPKDVLEVSLPKDKNDDVWEEIEALALQNRVRAGNGSPPPRPSKGRQDSRNKPEAKAVGRESGHGAMIKAKAPGSIEQLFAGVDASTRGVWLALDSLQDPQNLGAIFRSAAFFGVKGIVITSERSAPMTSTVYDIASGGVETITHVPVINLQRAFEKAKDAGLWILGTSEHAKESVQKLKNDRPWLIVVGNEEKGMRRLTEESCDMTCSIKAKTSGVTSLNVSVATGIMLSHLTLGA